MGYRNTNHPNCLIYLSSYEARVMSTVCLLLSVPLATVDIYRHRCISSSEVRDQGAQPIISGLPTNHLDASLDATLALPKSEQKRIIRLVRAFWACVCPLLFRWQYLSPKVFPLKARVFPSPFKSLESLPLCYTYYYHDKTHLEKVCIRIRSCAVMVPRSRIP